MSLVIFFLIFVNISLHYCFIFVDVSKHHVRFVVQENNLKRIFFQLENWSKNIKTKEKKRNVNIFM